MTSPLGLGFEQAASMFPSPSRSVLRAEGRRGRARRLRHRAVADNVGATWGDHSEFLGWLRDPANGFESSLLDLGEGTELAIRRSHGNSGH